MRYEIIREFAPCIGVEWQDHFGGTEDYLDPAGAEADRTVFVAGVRAWF
jgi:copper resistance protein B